MKNHILFLIAFAIAFAFSVPAFSQGVAINTDGTSANTSAMLDVKSTTSGMLIPRMSLAQKNLIATPATGLLIFQTDNTPGFYFYNGIAWQRLGTGNVESMTFSSPLSSTGGSNPTISISQSGAVSGQALEWNGSAWAPANDDNTTYSAGNQLGLTGTTFNVSEGTGSGLDADLLDGQHYSDIQTWVNFNDDNTTYSGGTGLTLTGTVFTPTFGTTLGTVSQGNHGHTNMMTGSGTANYVSKFNSANTLVNSQMFDNGTNVGIGTTTPSFKLDVAGNAAATVLYDKDNTSYSVDPTGSSYLTLLYTSQEYSSRFYDRDNTSYYLDPASTSYLNNVYSAYDYSIAFVDRDNTGYYVDPASTSYLNNVYSAYDYSIAFVDRDNTGYYVDPASTSNLLYLNVSGLRLGGSAGTSGQVLATNGTASYWTSAPTISSGTTNYLAKFTSGTSIGNSQVFDNGTNVGIGTSAPGYKLDVAGNAIATILYDKDNASYYLDPASTSNLATVYSGSEYSSSFYDRDNTSYYLDPASTSNLATVYSGIEYSSSFYDRDNTSYYLNPGGTSVLSAVQADILYDRNNTSFYVDPASTSFFYDLRSDILYDRNNTSFFVDPASTSILSTVRASILYDNDNTTYYVDPANYSNVTYLSVTGLRVGGSAGASGQVLATNGTNSYWTSAATISSGTTNYLAKFTSGTSVGNSQMFDNGTNVGIGTALPAYRLDVAGSAAATILYDKDNSSYYLDPTSTSNLSTVYSGAEYSYAFYDRDNTSYYLDPATTSYLYYVYSSVDYSSIFYDRDNTIYYLDPASTSNLATVYSLTDYSSIYYDRDNLSYYLNPAGTSVLSAVQADILYDRNNPSFYVDPASTSLFYDLRADIFYDRNNTSFYVDPASTSILSTVRASILYDHDNITYYVDPASYSNLTYLSITGLRVGGSAGTSGQVLATNGTNSYWTSAPTISSGTTNYIAKFTSGTSVGNSQIFDDGTNVGIGTAVPSQKLYVAGNFTCTGTKAATVRTEEGPKALYCVESTENWFEDFGSAEIINGQAIVKVKEDFEATITVNSENPIIVFITPKARIGEWWVEDKGTSFILHAPDAPDGSKFDFKIMAKRKGYEDLRLKSDPDAYTDHFLYPNIDDVPAEYREAWLGNQQKEQEGQIEE